MEKLYPDPVVGALGEVSSAEGVTCEEAPDFSPPEDDASSNSPSVQKILVALESCVFLTYTLPSSTHVKAKRPVFAIDLARRRSFLLCLVRCSLMYTGAGVKVSKMSEVLILLVLQQQATRPYCSGEQTELWLLGGTSCFSRPAVDVRWICPGAGSWLPGLGRPPSALCRCNGYTTDL